MAFKVASLDGPGEDWVFGDCLGGSDQLQQIHQHKDKDEDTDRGAAESVMGLLASHTEADWGSKEVVVEVLGVEPARARVFLLLRGHQGLQKFVKFYYRCFVT